MTTPTPAPEQPTPAPLTLTRAQVETLRDMCDQLLGAPAARDAEVFTEERENPTPPWRWAQTIATHGTGDTYTIDIDAAHPGGDTAVMELPLADARGLHDMLGDAIQAAEILERNAPDGVDTPGCDCGHDGMGPGWHLAPCPYSVRGRRTDAQRLADAETANNALRRRIYNTINVHGDFVGCPSAVTDDLMRVVIDHMVHVSGKLRHRTAALVKRTEELEAEAVRLAEDTKATVDAAAPSPKVPQSQDAELARLRTELAALRQVARGYCPACGRGDCAPTVHDWERERARAEHAEAERDELRDEITATVARLADMAKSRAEQDGAELVRLRERAEQAEAAIARVRALHRPVEGLGYGPDDDDTPGAYGDIAQVCSSCGTSGEHGVRWPCPTIAALNPPKETQP